MSSQEIDEWQTVVTKKTIRKEKQREQQQRTEQWRKNRDIRYLQTHSGFQKHRLTTEKVLELLKGTPNDGSLFVVSHGQCVGHLVSVNSNRQLCLQCQWFAPNGFVSHCCCPEEVVKELPPNFYLGCDGYLNDYLTTLRDKPVVYGKHGWETSIWCVMLTNNVVSSLEEEKASFREQTFITTQIVLKMLSITIRTGLGNFNSTPCLGTACLGTACLEAECLGRACLEVTCLGTVCLEASCLGTACFGTACLGTACLDTSLGNASH